MTPVAQPLQHSVWKLIRYLLCIFCRSMLYTFHHLTILPSSTLTRPCSGSLLPQVTVSIRQNILFNITALR